MPLVRHRAILAPFPRNHCKTVFVRIVKRPLLFAVWAALLLVVSATVATANPVNSDTTTTSIAVGEKIMSLNISSPSFSAGGEIPKKFTCDGTDVSPQLVWTEPPSGTKSFALLVDDPDAPVGNWNHWITWNLPASLRGLSEAVSKEASLPDGTQQGKNDFRKTGYNGPCPPAGKPHRYYFKLFALDIKLELKQGTSKRELEAAMKGHILAQAEWVGRYRR